jgi:hypothetical protein
MAAPQLVASWLLLFGRHVRVQLIHLALLLPSTLTGVIVTAGFALAMSVFLFSKPRSI